MVEFAEIVVNIIPADTISLSTGVDVQDDTESEREDVAQPPSLPDTSIYLPSGVMIATEVAVT